MFCIFSIVKVYVTLIRMFICRKEYTVFNWIMIKCHVTYIPYIKEGLAPHETLISMYQL